MSAGGRWRWPAALGAVVLAWLCAQQPVAPDGPPAGALRLASANLLHGSGAEPVAVAEALLALDADVLLLLEWTGDNADRQTLVDGGLGLFLDRAHPGTRGVALALSGRVAGAATLLRPGGTGPCAMPGALARVDWNGAEVGVLGVHPPPPVPGCGGATAASLAQVAGLLAEGRVGEGAPVPLPAGAPAVVLGDLNSLPVAPGLASLRGAGLVDGVLAHSWRPAPSWPVLPLGVSLGRIDGVWVPAGSAVVGAGTVPIPGSDHRAVWVDLGALPEAPR